MIWKPNNVAKNYIKSNLFFHTPLHKNVPNTSGKKKHNTKYYTVVLIPFFLVPLLYY